MSVAIPQSGSVAVEVRVWQSVASPDRYYVNARSGDGGWSGTAPLSLGSTSGGHRYGDVAVSVAIPEAVAPASAPAGRAMARPRAPS